jgi:hypothetical protein
MKAVLVLFICCFPLLAQSQPSTAACGNLNLSMAVNLDNSRHSVVQPEPGKARIYFIQDTGLDVTIAYPTTKIGIDGAWVGANKKNSWFSVSVEPGEHHLCAAIQSSFVRKDVELAHLKAEAGKVYFYRTRIIDSRSGPEYLGFVPVDSDEGEYLIASYPLAEAHARK